MALQIEVVSNSDAAKKDLDLLKAAIEKIKSVASSFSFNIKSNDVKTAADSFNDLNKNAGNTGATLNKLNSAFATSSSTARTAAGSFKDMSNTSAATAANVTRVGSSVESLANNTKASADGFALINAQVSRLTTGLVAASGAYASFSTFDKLTNISSQLKLATESQIEFNEALRGTQRIAIETRSGLFEVTDLYSKIARSTTTFSRSQADMLSVTETITKSIGLYGSTAQTSSAAIMQLGQALSSGKLGGDELRSIMENAPGLADAIAKGVGVTIGQLRELGTAGALTSKMIFQALLSQAEAVDRGFAKAGTTFSQAFGNIGNSMLALMTNTGTAMGSLLLPGGKTIPEHINSIAIAIANFASKLDWMFLKIRANVLILQVELYDLVRKPLTFQVAFIKAKLSDFLPSQSDIQSYIGNVFSFISPIFSGVQRRAAGGRIYGAGTGTSDSVPAMLSNGEYVIKASAVAGNLPLLDSINNGGVRHFATGGPVGAVSSFGGIDISYEFKRLRTTIEDVFKSLITTITQPGKLGSFAMNSVSASLTLLKNGYQKSMDFLNKYIMPYIDKAIFAIGKYTGSVLDAMTSSSPAFAKFVETTRSLTRTGPYTGGGPFRLPENRSVLHDVVNTFIPERQQVPVLIGATAAIAAGIVAVTQTGNFRSILLGLMTTGAALVINSTVTDKAISDFQGRVAESFLGITKKVTDALFGSGIFGERGFAGTLMLLAKLSLMFAAGREAIVKGLTGAATAPTNFANGLAMRGQSMVMDGWSKVLNTKLDLVNAGILKSNTNASDIAKAALKDLQSASPNKLAAAQLMNGTYAGAVSPALRSMADAAIAAKTNLERVTEANRQSVKAITENTANITKQSEALKSQIAAQNEAFKRGVVNTAGGIGGVFGMLAGFNIGADIAKGMTGSSEWMKVGVTLASALLGQAVLAGIASTLTTMIVGALGLAFSPVILGITALVGAAALAYKYFTDTKWTEDLAHKLWSVADVWIAAIGKAFPSLIPTSMVDSAEERVLVERLNLLVGSTPPTSSPAAATAGGVAATAGGVAATAPAVPVNSIGQPLNATTPLRPSGPYQEYVDKSLDTNVAIAIASAIKRADNAPPIEQKMALVEALTLKRLQSSLHDLHNVGSQGYSNMPKNTESRVNAAEELVNLYKGDPQNAAFLAMVKDLKETTARIRVGLDLQAKSVDRFSFAEFTEMRAVGESVAKATIAIGAPRGTFSMASPTADPLIQATIEKYQAKTSEVDRQANLATLDAVTRAARAIPEAIAGIRHRDNEPSAQEMVKDFFGRLSAFFSTRMNETTEQYNARQKKATGGFISGPGTGTSDSIPAMLSNGEFVVNAKASAANVGILHAINNGAAVSHFAEGRTFPKMSERQSEILKGEGGWIDKILEISRTVALPPNVNARKIAEAATILDPNLIANTMLMIKSQLFARAGWDDDPKKRAETDSMLKPAIALSLSEGPLNLVKSFKSDLLGKKPSKEAELLYDNIESSLIQSIFAEAAIGIASSLGAAKLFKTGWGLSKRAFSNIKSLFKDKDILKKMETPDFDKIMPSSLLSFAGVGGAGALMMDVLLGQTAPMAGGVSRGLRLKGDYQGMDIDLSMLLHNFENTYGDTITPLFPAIKHAAAKIFAIKLQENMVDTHEGETISKKQRELAANKRKQVNIPSGEPGNPVILDSRELEKFATGGFIRGPGTGTSDSIPAMLSNGEFVINAKASAANAGILHAINSGEAVSHFAGGRTGDIKTYQANADLQIIDLDPLRKELRDYAMAAARQAKISEQFVDALIRSESGYNRDASSGSGAKGVMQFIKKTGEAYGLSSEERISNPKKAIDAGIAHLKDLSTKYKGDLEKVAAAYNQGERVVDKVLKASNNTLDLSKMPTLEPSAFLANIRNKGGFGNTVASTSAVTLATASTAAAGQPVIQAAGAIKDDMTRAKDELFSDGFFGKLTRSAFEMLPASFQEILIQVVGSIRKMLGPKVASIGDVLSKDIEELTDDINTAINDIDFKVDALAVEGLSSADISALRGALTTRKNATEALASGKFNGLPAVELQRVLDEATDQLKQIFSKKDSEAHIGKGAMSSNVLVTQFELIGETLSNFDLTKFTSNELSAIEEQFRLLEKLKNTLPIANEAERERIRLMQKEIELALKGEVARIKPTSASVVEEANAASEAAGTTFAAGMQSTFESSLADGIKGKSRLKDIGIALVDKFTSGVIDSAVKSFSDGLFKTIFSDFFKSIGSSMSSMGSVAAIGSNGGGGASGFLNSTFKSLSRSFEKPVSKDGLMRSEKALYGYTSDKDGPAPAIAEAMDTSTKTLGETITSALEKGGEGLGGLLGGLFKNIFGGGGISGGGFDLVGLLGKGLSSIGSMFSMPTGMFWAEGGQITGPGSGTSDSIPAMLSNGEFVVNAAATSQYKGLLDRINSGKLPKFASGGYVGLQSVESVAATRVASASQKTSQKSVFNINVTGDISQQTRREIQQMIPQIASGVNARNYEQGIRT